MLPNARALLVTVGMQASAVTQALESHGLAVDHVSTCREARAAIERHADYDLIITDVSLIDGNWWTISRDLARLGRQAELVVCVPPGDQTTQCTLSSTRGLAEVLLPPYNRASIENLIERLGLVGCGLLGMAAGA